MKCKNCIFGKDVDSDTTKCYNLRSDEYGQLLFTQCDGCNVGKSSTIGITEVERRSLYNMQNQDLSNQGRRGYGSDRGERNYTKYV